MRSGEAWRASSAGRRILPQATRITSPPSRSRSSGGRSSAAVAAAQRARAGREEPWRGGSRTASRYKPGRKYSKPKSRAPARPSPRPDVQLTVQRPAAAALPAPAAALDLEALIAQIIDQLLRGMT